MLCVANADQIDQPCFKATAIIWLTPIGTACSEGTPTDGCGTVQLTPLQSEGSHLRLRLNQVFPRHVASETFIGGLLPGTVTSLPMFSTHNFTSSRDRRAMIP